MGDGREEAIDKAAWQPAVSCKMRLGTEDVQVLINTTKKHASASVLPITEKRVRSGGCRRVTRNSQSQVLSYYRYMHT